MPKTNHSTTTKGCWNCFQQQDIENKCCNVCSSKDFYPVEVLMSTQKDKAEWEVFVRLIDDPDFLG